MIGFFLKKTFFDGWDHLFSLVLVNAVFLLLAALGLLLPSALKAPAWLVFTTAGLALLAAALWWSTAVFALRSVADFHSLKLENLESAFRAGWVPGLQFAAMLGALWLLVTVGLPFYLAHAGLFGVIAAGLLFWFGLTALLALQFYLPLRARLGGGFRKNIRKSFILFFDNPLFSLFLLVYNLLSFLLSGFLAFLAPGPAGVALALDCALRLRLYKYDWLEKNPGAGRRSPPWDELLAEDRELVGTRTLKGMIFPWKD